MRRLRGFTAPFSTTRVSRWLRRRWREYC